MIVESKNYNNFSGYNIYKRTVQPLTHNKFGTDLLALVERLALGGLLYYIETGSILLDLTVVESLALFGMFGGIYSCNLWAA